MTISENVQWHANDLFLRELDCCDNRDHKTVKFRRSDGLAIQECDSCGLASVSPCPTYTALERYYSNYLTGGGDFYKDADYFRLRIESIENEDLTGASWVKENVKLDSSAMLDLGAADGALLEWAKINGVNEVSGLEMSQAGIDRAKSAFGIELTSPEKSGRFPFRDEVFDIVTGFDFIEHVLDPKIAFLEITRVLKKGGIFLGNTPNWTAFSYFGAAFQGVQTNFEHLQYFSENSLRAATLRAGMLIEKILYKGISTKMAQYRNGTQRFKTIRNPNVSVRNAMTKLAFRVLPRQAKAEFYFAARRI